MVKYVCVSFLLIFRKQIRKHHKKSPSWCNNIFFPETLKDAGNHIFFFQRLSKTLEIPYFPRVSKTLWKWDSGNFLETLEKSAYTLEIFQSFQSQKHCVVPWDHEQGPGPRTQNRWSWPGPRKSRIYLYFPYEKYAFCAFGTTKSEPGPWSSRWWSRPGPRTQFSKKHCVWIGPYYWTLRIFQIIRSRTIEIGETWPPRKSFENIWQKSSESFRLLSPLYAAQSS